MFPKKLYCCIDGEVNQKLFAIKQIAEGLNYHGNKITKLSF